MSTQTRVGAAQTRSQDTRTPDAGNTTTQPTPNMPMNTRPVQEMSPGMAGAARGTETKPALKSTELYIYLAAVAGVLAASQLAGQNAAGVDIFRADQAWLYIALLTIGYLVSRGLAKAGSAWRHAEDRNR